MFDYPLSFHSLPHLESCLNETATFVCLYWQHLFMDHKKKKPATYPRLQLDILKLISFLFGYTHETVYKMMGQKAVCVYFLGKNGRSKKMLCILIITFKSIYLGEKMWYTENLYQNLPVCILEVQVWYTSPH